MLRGKVILTGILYCFMVAQSTEINLLLYVGLGLDILTNWLIVGTVGCFYYWSLGCCWFGFEETVPLLVICSVWRTLLIGRLEDGEVTSRRSLSVWLPVFSVGATVVWTAVSFVDFFLDASFLAKWSRRKKGNIRFLVHSLVRSPEPLLTKVVVGVLLLRAIMMIIIMMVCRLAVFFGNNCVITAGYGWVDVATSMFVPIFSYLHFDRFWLTFLFLGSFVLLPWNFIYNINVFVALLFFVALAFPLRFVGLI